MKYILAENLEDLKRQIKEDKDIETLADIANGAHRPVSNLSSEFILINETNEAVFMQEVYSGGSSKITEHEVEYAGDGRPYFEPEGNHASRRYINEYLRNNYTKGYYGYDKNKKGGII